MNLHIDSLILILYADHVKKRKLKTIYRTYVVNGGMQKFQ